MGIILIFKTLQQVCSSIWRSNLTSLGFVGMILIKPLGGFVVQFKDFYWFSLVILSYNYDFDLQNPYDTFWFIVMKFSEYWFGNLEIKKIVYLGVNVNVVCVWGFFFKMASFPKYWWIHDKDFAIWIYCLAKRKTNSWKEGAIVNCGVFTACDTHSTYTLAIAYSSGK